MSFRRFIVWRPESGQNEKDGLMVYAYCAEEAVERWARGDRDSPRRSGRRWRRVGGRMYLDVARQTNEMAAD